jgi:hypothetical protein
MTGLFGRKSSPSQTWHARIKGRLYPWMVLPLLCLTWAHFMPVELQAADAPVFLPKAGALPILLINY